VIFPFHRLIEKMSEARENRVPIGTTQRGIGPCYEDKIGRRGIRIADLFDPDSFRNLYDALAEDKRILAGSFLLDEPIDYALIREQTEKFAERIRPLVCDTAELLASAFCSRARRAPCSTSTTELIPLSPHPAPLPAAHAPEPASRRRESPELSVSRRPISRAWARVRFPPKAIPPRAIFCAAKATSSAQ
jgi:hypothetical protein